MTPLTIIPDAFCNNLVDIMKGRSREDDSLEPNHTTLTSWNTAEEFLVPRKPSRNLSLHACESLSNHGSGWIMILKSIVQQSIWHFSIVDKFNDDTADGSPKPSEKRQQAALLYVFLGRCASLWHNQNSTYL